VSLLRSWCSSSKNWSPFQVNFVVKIKCVHKRLSNMTQNEDYSMYSTFLTASPGSALFSRSNLLKRKDLCFSCLRLGLTRHRRSLRSSHLSSQVLHDSHRVTLDSRQCFYWMQPCPWTRHVLPFCPWHPPEHLRYSRGHTSDFNLRFH
jgi:hypothetical protein